MKPNSRSSPRDDGETIADWGELRFLDWVRRRLDSTVTDREQIRLAIGDDAAHLRLARRDLIVTTDAMIEGVHFDFRWMPARDLGARLLTANLSDLAAMAALPVASFLTLGVPPREKIERLKEFFAGLRSLSLERRCPVAGGDLVRADRWTLNLVVLGRPAHGRRVVRRSAAKPGHAVYVTGWPGESAAGLRALRERAPFRRLISRHLKPAARIPEAAVLARVCRQLAMIDVSDGVANDAGHIARESGVGIELERAALPLGDALKRYAAKLKIDPIDWVLDGGEDFELLFTTSTAERKIRAELEQAGLLTPVTRIGRVVEGGGVHLVDERGNRLERRSQQFQHFE